MKNVLIRSTFLVLAFFLFSCSGDNASNKNSDLNPTFENFNLDLKIDWTSTFNLNEYDLDQLVGEIVKELYEFDVTEQRKYSNSGIIPNSSETVPYIAADLIFNDNILTVIPICGEEPIVPQGDNEDCGGKAGDGWTSYGTCMKESCVEELVKEATSALSSNLTRGKCLDIRIKRNLLNARVCARVVDC